MKKLILFVAFLVAVCLGGNTYAQKNVKKAEVKKEQAVKVEKKGTKVEKEAVKTEKKTVKTSKKVVKKDMKKAEKKVTPPAPVKK